MKEKISCYDDALNNIFGNYSLKLSSNGTFYIKTENGAKYVLLSDKIDDCLCISTKDEFRYDGFKFSLSENGIEVSEIKFNLHECGVNVELIDRLYGISRYDDKKYTLLDLQSTNYVIKNYSSFDELIDRNFLENNSLLTTTFSAHMRSFYEKALELRSYVSTMYPSHVFFNSEDISQTYEFVDGIDKISRVYNLYSGNVKKDSEDMKTIIDGFVDTNSFNYKNKSILVKVRELIGNPWDMDTTEQLIDEYIQEYGSKMKPILTSLRDATRIEVGITPTQSRDRVNEKIDSIIDDSISSKIMKFIRKIKRN